MRSRLSRLLLLIVLPGILLAAAEHTSSGAEEAGGQHETFWKTVNFVILVGALGWGLKKAGGKFFRSRTENIRQEMAEARKLKEEAEERVAGIERRMEKLDEEIAELRASARREMEAEKARFRNETERLLARMQSNAEREIASAAKQARNELRAYASELALRLARQKIRQRMTPEVAGRLMDRFVNELGRLPRGLN